MDPPRAGDALPAFDFLSEFLPAPDFGESYRFNRLFNFDDAGDLPLIGGYEDDSCSFYVESYVVIAGIAAAKKKRRANRVYHKQSALLLPWNVNFLPPGFTQDLTHELPSSDCFCKFCSLFQTKLEKVEELTNFLVEWGYIVEPR
jgi:hypothetical protein